MGRLGAELCGMEGLRLPLQPLRGYQRTLPLGGPSAGHEVSLIDPAQGACNKTACDLALSCGLLGASNHSAQHHGGPNARSNYGPHSARDISGGPQAGGDGQRYNLADSGDEIHALGYSSFQSRGVGLEQRVSMVETHITSSLDRDQELLYLRSKLIDLEDRSRRDNARFLGFPEYIEGADTHSYLRETLPKLNGLTFDPIWNFKECTD
ncbi:hypothetical protein NDU88_001805 [Pleurodeles waltl]|uniref:Uncharacterized protein n=1 Tax=Pleurodeles waltl TaxID=8319 RepID=A0AAV7UTS2_PLEWA|nr:hypothetical protein NDU88_001805 [Pleurodeles waltl]